MPGTMNVEVAMVRATCFMWRSAPKQRRRKLNCFSLLKPQKSLRLTMRASTMQSASQGFAIFL